MKNFTKCFIFVFLIARISGATEVPSQEAATNQAPATSTEASTPNVETNPEATPSEPAKEPTVPTKNEKRRWQLGPSVSVSFPRFTEYALEYKSGSGLFSAALLSGGINLKADSNLTADLSNFELRGRWHPFLGSFFLGLGFGSQSIKVHATETINSVDVNVDLDIKSSYMVPHIGWFSVYSFGLTLGFDIGMIVPSNVKTELTTNAPSAIQSTADYEKTLKDTTTKGDQLGKISLPYMTLLKIGWLF